jgi:4-amino-4-deoxy-L-arabinose transferase-like glycosyltransferase
LTLLCLIAYGTGLTSHGLTNWQEAQRALVAREMYTMGEWIVPYAHGTPYLAKPPLIYWCQFGLARLSGQGPSEWHLRATVAIAGWLGVLATWWAANRLGPLWRGVPPPMGASSQASSGAVSRASSNANSRDTSRLSIGFWAGALLATGVLYARSSRLGELDILLAPTTVLAVLAQYECWQRRDVPLAMLPWLVLAGAATALASLAKGPPALMVIALAALGGIVWHARSAIGTPRWSAAVSLMGGLAMLGTFIGVNGFSRQSPIDLDWMVGLVFAGCAGVILGQGLAAIASRQGIRTVLCDLWRTQPWWAMGLALLASWLWLRAVAERIGWVALENTRAAEASDNLRLFVPESPWNNLQAASYGVGLGSLAAIATAFWLWRRARHHPPATSPAVTPAGALVLAWIVLGLITFSLLGKGVGRYLTPLWPAIAMLGGAGLHAWLASREPARQARARTLALVLVAVLAIGQGAWYGYGMERLQAARSPRGLIEELRQIGPHWPIVAVDFSTPALDYYAGTGTMITKSDLEPGFADRRTEQLNRLLFAMMSGEVGGGIVLARERSETFVRTMAGWQGGLAVRQIELEHEFVIDNGRSKVRAWLVLPTRDKP